ncbi:MAG: HAD family hydrolase [Pseudomonadota bacterium]|nr:HAD family hydrolase [Pseudomonadota bacterium]
MYKIALFDFDGTLCDSHEANIQCLQAVFSSFSFPVPAREKLLLLFSTGQSIKRSIASLLEEMPSQPIPVDQVLQVYRQQYLAYALPYSSLYDGVIATLQAISAKAEVLIVSNHNEIALGKLIDHFKLQPYIRTYMGQAPGVELKPATWFYTEKIQKIYPSVPTSDFLMVGDTMADIGFAKACSIPIAWVSYGYGKIDSDTRSSINHVVDNPSELIELF